SHSAVRPRLRDVGAPRPYQGDRRHRSAAPALAQQGPARHAFPRARAAAGRPARGRHPQRHAGWMMDGINSLEPKGTAPKRAPAARVLRGALAILHRFRKLYSVVLVLLGWELLAIAIHNPLFLPRLSVVLETIYALASTGQLFTDIQASLTRALGGFAV